MHVLATCRMADSIIARNKSTMPKDLMYIRSHSGLAIGLAPYLFNVIYNRYENRLFVK